MSTAIGYPFTTVVYITFNIGNNGFQASGVLIAPDEVLTASHVITSTNQGTSSNIQVTAAYNGITAPYGTIGVAATHYNNIFNPNDTITSEQSQNDYAVIHLAHPFTNAGTMSLLADWPGGTATEDGYPGSGQGVPAQNTGTFTKEAGYTLYTGADTGPGSSGGPVFIDQGFGPQVVGLVSAGNGRTGFFPIITSNVLAQIQQWVAADDGLVVASKLTLPSSTAFTIDIAAYEKRALTGSQPPVALSDATAPILFLKVTDITTARDALNLLVAPFSIDLGTTAATSNALAVKGTNIGFTSKVTAIQFADGRLVYDPADPAAQVTRLYGAAFGRAADERGLVAWTSAIQSGASVTQVAGSFVASGEFQSRYGASLSDNSFVTQLYSNVLNRAPDAAGIAAWDSRLASGLSRGAVLTGFSESSEYVAATTNVDKSGIFVLDAAAPEVARLYETVLGRLPDAAGMRFFDDAIDRSGASLTNVADALLSSGEYQSNFGKLSSADFVTTLYRTTLHRAPDAAGAAVWNSDLNSGALTRSQVAIGFSESVEHSILSASNVYGATPISYGVTLV